MYLDVLSINTEYSNLFEASKQTTHGFFGEAEIVADLDARHAQVEFAWRKTALEKTLGKTQEKRGQPLFTALLPELSDLGLLLCNLAAHDSKHLARQTRKLLGQLLEVVKWDLANARYFEGFGRTMMPPRGNGIEPDEFPRKMESRDLFPAVLNQRVGFNRTRPYRVKAAKRIANAEQVLTTMYRAATFHDFIKEFEVSFLDANRQAQLEQTAVLARNFECGKVVESVRLTGHEEPAIARDYAKENSNEVRITPEIESPISIKYPYNLVRYRKLPEL